MVCGPKCLLCCRSLHSPLILETGQQGQCYGQAEVFDVFCEYMKLDPEISVQDEYRGKLFPFCAPCSFQVYKLVAYHQEKTRILQTLSQMMTSMVTLLLESETENQTDYLDSGSLVSENMNLAEQIVTLRKRVINNFSPRVALNTIEPAELSRLTKNLDHVLNNQERISLRAQSPDICQQVKTEVISSEEEIDFGADSMEVDYDLEAASIDDSSDHSVDEDDEPVIARKRSPPAASTGLNRKTREDGKQLKRNHSQTEINSICLDSDDSSDHADSEDQEPVIARKRSRPRANSGSESTSSVATDNDDCSDYSADEDEEPVIARKRSRPRANPGSKRKGRVDGNLFKSNHTQIGENIFSIENCIYELEDNVFKCSEAGCSYTANPRPKMHRHVLEAHARVIPPVPEKSLEDFKIDENKYMLGNKFLFEKDPKENIFRCSRCEYTSLLWSTMYYHIFKLHYRRVWPATTTTTRLTLRPIGEVKKLGENEYEYLGIKYFVLPQGSHKCGFCGALRLTAEKIKSHIREHVHFMPEVPDKSLEECKLATDLYWLSRKYIFEKTGDHFTCSYGGCYEVRSTWEGMYGHIRTDHWRSEYTSILIKRQRRKARVAMRSGSQAGVEANNKGNDQESKVSPKNRDRSGADLKRSVNPSLASSRDTPRVAQLINNSHECESKDPDVDHPENKVKKSPKRRKVKRPNADSSRMSKFDVFPLADLETSPGIYAYRGFEFRISDDELFSCDSCPYTTRRGKSSMLLHIQKHVQNSDGFKEVRPNEYLYLQEYPGTKEPDGRFRCGVEGCEFVTSFSLLGLLKTHILKSHLKVSPPLDTRVVSEDSKHRSAQLKHHLSKCETGPGQYKYRGFDFHLVEDQFECDTCSFRCSRSRDSLPILGHISKKHVDPNQRIRYKKSGAKLEEVRPDEFLYDGRLTAFRLPDGRFKCGVEGCTSLVIGRQGLTKHMSLTHPENPIVCEMCGRVYRHSTTLRIHMNSVHTEAEEQICPLCEKSFPTAFALKTHLRRSHAKK